MGFSFSNLFDPAGITTGDAGDWVANSVNPLGGFLHNAGVDVTVGGDDPQQGFSNWLDDLNAGDTAIAKNRWDNWRKGDGLERMAMSGDLYASGSPWGTKLNNEVFGRDDKPIWDTLGGKTKEDYQYAENQGVDTNAIRGLDQVGSGIGKGVINGLSFGLGSSAIGALDNWGYGESNADLLKNTAKNAAISYAFTNGLEGAGDAMTATPVGEAGNAGMGDYKAFYDNGGSTTFNAGAQLGVSPAYQGAFNGAATGAAKGGLTAAANGGDSGDIGRGALSGGLQGGLKNGGSMFKDLFGGDGEMPDTGTLGGNMRDSTGELDPRVQEDANSQARMAALGTPAGLPTDFGGGREQPQGFNPLAGAFSSVTTPQGAWPGVTAGNVGNWGQVGTGLYGLWKARQLEKLGRPTGAQLGARGNLEALMRDPSSIVNMPGYKAGEQAVTRSQAAGGYLGSGNMMAALKDFGGGFYNDTLRTMSGLAQPTPDQMNYNVGGAQLTGNSLQSLIYGGMGLANPDYREQGGGRVPRRGGY